MTNQQQAIKSLLLREFLPSFEILREKSRNQLAGISRQLRSPLGFVGIANLHSICYMNAVLQQLFMIKPFRKHILEAKPNPKNKHFLVFQEL